MEYKKRSLEGYGLMNTNLTLSLCLSPSPFFSPSFLFPFFFSSSSSSQHQFIESPPSLYKLFAWFTAQCQQPRVLRIQGHDHRAILSRKTISIAQCLEQCPWLNCCQLFGILVQSKTVITLKKKKQKPACRPKQYEYMFSIADCASPHKSVQRSCSQSNLFLLK